jgi:hypothetical protein
MFSGFAVYDNDIIDDAFGEFHTDINNDSRRVNETNAFVLLFLLSDGHLYTQSEYGDIYKVTLDYKTVGEGDVVSELKIKYFDTIPTCAAICVLKTGFLFAGSEFGNHALYQFQGIGDHADDVESSSSTLMETEEGFQPVKIPFTHFAALLQSCMWHSL